MDSFVRLHDQPSTLEDNLERVRERHRTCRTICSTGFLLKNLVLQHKVPFPFLCRSSRRDDLRPIRLQSIVAELNRPRRV